VTLARAIVAEGLGGALTAIVGSFRTPVSGGNAAIALPNSAAAGCALYVLIATFGAFRAHFNPVVTCCYRGRRELHRAPRRMS
jgi:glycerol uptake facilitator-like aquaporin